LMIDLLVCFCALIYGSRAILSRNWLDGYRTTPIALHDWIWGLPNTPFTCISFTSLTQQAALIDRSIERGGRPVPQSKHHPSHPNGPAIIILLAIGGGPGAQCGQPGACAAARARREGEGGWDRHRCRPRLVLSEVARPGTGAFGRIDRPLIDWRLDSWMGMGWDGMEDSILDSHTPEPTLTLSNRIESNPISRASAGGARFGWLVDRSGPSWHQRRERRMMRRRKRRRSSGWTRPPTRRSGHRSP
jgi:hypothetical protein